MITNELLRRVIPVFTHPVHKLVRRLRGQPDYLCRLNHPATARQWDRRKGLRGWIASDQSVSSVVVRSEQGRETQARLELRRDVEWHLGFKYRRQSGFITDRKLGDWLSESDLPKQLVLTFESGRTATQAICLELQNESQAARFEKFRPLYRCPACRSELKDRAVEALVCPQCDRQYPVRAGVVDFLPERASEDFGADDTDNVSSWDYDNRIPDLIAERPDGIYLDCGAGFRRKVYPNVINLDIVDYSSTDIVGVGEQLPFADSSLDGVISVAVLEHVRDPFRCAAELRRVIKPGGWIFAAVPFLQPLHAYPHHYYNMTADGLRNLFADFSIVEQFVPMSVHPIQALRWFVHSYCKGLPDRERKMFERMTLKQIMSLPQIGEMERKPPAFVENLSESARFEIASATCLVARKPGR